MPNEFMRKCSHCGHNGHNTRTCVKGCTRFKLFGVQIDVDDGVESSIRKSKSMGNMQTCKGESNGVEGLGYLSDGIVHKCSKSHEKIKGKPWSEDEHRSFLVGLEKLGKGDWKGIAKNYVPTRNSSQVASHAQKYFIRKSATRDEKKNRRGSVFDIPPPEQGMIPASVSGSHKPPLSPRSRRNMSLMPRIPSFTQAYPTQTPSAMPTVSWVPVVNFPSQSNIFLPGIRGRLENCATFMPQPSYLTLQQSIQHGSSQAVSAFPTPNTEELNLNIRNLAV